jgi:hypothetical protein
VFFMNVRLVVVLVILSILILGGLDAMSSSPYYWLREGVYFLYDVRSDSRASCVVIDHSSGYWFRFPFNNLKVKWSVLRVEGEWMFVNFSMIAFNAKNLNTSESLNIERMSNCKTMLSIGELYEEALHSEGGV